MQTIPIHHPSPFTPHFGPTGWPDVTMKRALNPMSAEVLHRANDAGVYFPVGTPDDIIDALEVARISTREGDNSIRIYYGDTDSGRDWLETEGTTGRIVKSQGRAATPALLDPTFKLHDVIPTAIVRITLHSRGQLVGQGRELYRHPTYSLPTFTIKETSGHTPRYCVAADGVPLRSEQLGYGYDITGFPSRKDAQYRIWFLQGEVNIS